MKSKQSWGIFGESMTDFGFATIPTGFGVGSRVFSQAIDTALLAIRESLANARTFKASNGAVYLVQIKGIDYIAFAHDGTPFTDLDEILNLGVMPNRTGGKGQSLQGCGLVYSASHLHMKAKMVIGSFCAKDGKFKAGLGEPDLNQNRWNVSDVTDEYYEPLKNLFGKKINNYSVFYLFRIDLKPKDNRSYLSVELMNTLAYACPNFVGHDFSLIFGDIQLGCKSYGKSSDDSEDKKLSNQGRVDKYSSLDSSTESGFRRNVPGLVEYEARYLEKKFVIPSKPYQIQLQHAEKTLEIEQADVVVSVFRGKRKEVDGGWLVNARDGDLVNDGKIWKHFSKDGASNQGKRPRYASYLYMPCVAAEAEANKDERSKNAFSRFLDNAVYFISDASDYIRLLDLPYNSQQGHGDSKADKPFCIVSVNIHKIGRIITAPNKDEPAQVEAASALMLSQMMDRRPDFTFGRRDMNRTIIQGALEAAVENVPEELKSLMAQLFKMDEQDEVPILMGNGGVTKTEPTQSPYSIFDVRTGREFGGVFHAGGKELLQLRDIRTGKEVPANRVSILHSRCRGVVTNPLSDQAAIFSAPEVEKGLSVIENFSNSRSNNEQK
jgi:hypothetical protein